MREEDLTLWDFTDILVKDEVNLGEQNTAIKETMLYDRFVEVNQEAIDLRTSVYVTKDRTKWVEESSDGSITT